MITYNEYWASVEALIIDTVFEYKELIFKTELKIDKKQLDPILWNEVLKHSLIASPDHHLIVLMYTDNLSAIDKRKKEKGGKIKEVIKETAVYALWEDVVEAKSAVIEYLGYELA